MPERLNTTIKFRGERGNLDKFMAVLDKVKDVPPDEYDA